MLSLVHSNICVDIIFMCFDADLCLPAPVVKVLAERLPPCELLALETATKGESSNCSCSLSLSLLSFSVLSISH